MKIALISDVHANLPALTAVLADIERAGISRIWCLGDTLGYGPFPNECCELVMDACEVVLAGNHDLAVRGDISSSLFRGSAGAGVAYARTHLTPTNMSSLTELRPFAFTDEAELYHASANDWVWEYVRDTPTATRHLSTQRMNVSFMGHSHEQRYFRMSADASNATGDVCSDGSTIELLDGKYAVNPGSVGQPRDRDPRAAWAVFEPGVAVTMQRTEYDIAAMRTAIAAAHLPPEVGERLELGW